MAFFHITFLEEYPEFSSIPESAVKRLCKESGITLNPAVWGLAYAMARGLWTAHYLAMVYDIDDRCTKLGMRSPSQVGAVTGRSVSSSAMSVTMARSQLISGDDPITSDFGRTTYGIRYLHLLVEVVPVGSIVYSADTSDSLQRS